MRKVYAVRDNKVGAFAGPCLFENDATAMRSFGDLVCRDKESLMGMHPEDFSLWCLGTFDLDTGVLLQNVEDFRALCNASDFVKGK